MRSIFTVLLAIYFSSSLVSQVENLERYLEMEEHEIYTEATAFFIKNNRKVSYEFDRSGPQVNYSYDIQIKILDESAFDWATFEVALRQGDTDEYLYDVEAKVYNLEEGAITIDVLKKSNIYKEDQNYYILKTFALPNVQVGSVIEVKYKKTSPFIYTIPRHYFQYEIPVDYSELEIYLPNKMIYTPISKGSHPFTTAQKDFNVHTPPTRRFNLVASNVPPIVADDFVLNIDDYRTSIMYELHTFYFDNGTKSSFSKSWDQIAKELNAHNDFGKRIRKKVKPLGNILKEAELLSGRKKIQFIYDFVRENFSWNGNYGKYAELGTKELLRNKSGNVGDINLLLVNLLKRSDLEAHPVMIKSRNRGVLNPEYPSVTEPNYTIAQVKWDDKVLYLDATAKEIPMGQLPLRAINTVGVVLFKKSAEIVEMTNPNNYKKQSLYDFSFIPEKKALVGSNKSRYSEFAATQYRVESDKEGESDQDLKRNVNDIYDLISHDNLENIYTSITTEESAQISSNIEEIDGKLFIGALIENFTDKNVFTTQKRSTSVFLNHRMDIKKAIKLTIPEDYKIMELPESKSFALPGQEGVFHYEIKDMIDYLMINYTVKISKTEFSAYEYPQLRVFMERIFKKQGEKIILEKKINIAICPIEGYQTIAPISNYLHLKYLQIMYLQVIDF